VATPAFAGEDVDVLELRVHSKLQAMIAAVRLGIIEL